MVRSKVVPDNDKKELSEILKISGETINDCMQCGKCTAGCPATGGMDILPHQIIRDLQLGQVKKVIESKTIWSCASCFACASRCPRNVDLARLIEAARLLIVRKKGSDRLKPETVSELMEDKKMPQQAVVSAFRKYNK
ncbi:4Fe-4S dicluster domain-containing protein [Ilyobacter polytropus]|uniref:Heterodisulfide reductase subunit C-like protein n=1 Tax=Ilyobacter polytropus (strain ATCC 51220 / DSM 2926 / LMG 16218 / CuHBu1) TaxID=572544 RepID=E3HBZ8_ILYPC|nr:4Fe-4S dicluster domain-containing protein [Ilyobacter polytropus]ADO84324.1 heterodisulfide reductase subunit C-like protein [Ilyobacter polytropus DSM 2926]